MGGQQEDDVPCPLQYFGEDWASIKGRLPPTPPPSSTSSRRTSFYHDLSHIRRGVEIAGVKILATTLPEKCGDKEQSCKVELIEMVLVDEIETIIDASESEGDSN